MRLSRALLAFVICVMFVATRCDDEAAPATAAGDQKSTLAELTEEQVEKVKSSSERHNFQAEVNRLMDIIINSLYSNREVFIRELISNASDALDKIRFESLTNKAVLGTNPELEIRVSFDKDAKTLTVQDTGIGMTKADLISHLGTVANSGTTAFLEKMKAGEDSVSLIGQFGVGFYSVYLVADRVTVVSKHHDDEQYVWQSDAKGEFSVSRDPRGSTLGRGTAVILHFKEDALEYLEQYQLENLIKKYSQFIQFPIYLRTKRTESKEVPAEEGEEGDKDKEKEEKKEGEEDVEVTDSDKEEEEKKPKTKTVSEELVEWKRQNEQKAIWTRNPTDVTEEEYVEFYKTLAKAYDKPITYSHFSGEGEIAFKAILYVPESAPYDLYDKYYGKSTSLKLYVRRVLISEEFEDFIPRYLNFIKGVVDSDDLPLNVSRETLSKNRVLKVMGKKLTRKALDMVRKLADSSESAATELEELAKKKSEKEEGEEADKEEGEKEKKEGEEDESKKKQRLEEEAGKYEKFFKQFGKSIKLGVLEDSANKNRLLKLLRWTTSKSDGKMVSLQQYVDGMKDDQEYIYYITGESIAVVERSPFIERLRKAGLQIIYMVDPLDEYLMSNVQDFDGKKFMSVTKEGLKLPGEDSKGKDEAMKQAYSKLTKWLKDLYGDKVEKVEVSNRIAQSPAVLVTSQFGWTANMERIMKAQTFSDSERQRYMVARKTLEINPRHPIVREMRERVETNAEDELLKDQANLLYDAALLTSGFQMDKPEDFASRIHRVLSTGLNIDPNASIDEDWEPPKTEEEDEEAAEAESEEAAAAGDDGADEEVPADKEEL